MWVSKIAYYTTLTQHCVRILIYIIYIMKFDVIFQLYSYYYNSQLGQITILGNLFVMN